MNSTNATACPACAENSVHEWREARAADRRAAKDVYHLGRCTSCGTAVTLDRTPADAEALYRGGIYAPPSRAAELAIRPLRALGQAATLRCIGAQDGGASVLEIGAGDGRLMASLRRRGWSVNGIEPFASVERAADDIAPLRVEEAVDGPKYDVVLLWHVLEHLDDPHAALDYARRSLRPGGRVVVSVPDLDSLQARLGGDRWFHQDVPRHVVHFTRRGLLRLLDRSGLEKTRTCELVLDQNLLGMAQTLLNRVTRQPNVGFRLLKRDLESVRASDLALTALGGIPAVLTGSLLEAAAMLRGRGGSIAVEAISAP